MKITRTAVSIALHLTEKEVFSQCSIGSHTDAENGLYWIRIDLGQHDISIFTSTIQEHEVLRNLLGVPRPKVI